MEVAGKPYKDKSPIWKDDVFPSRLKVKVVTELTAETAVPVIALREKLSFFQNLSNPLAWTGHFRSSPVKFEAIDGEAITEAILDAKNNPVVRPVDRRKLKYRPPALKAKIGSVTVPESEQDDLFKEQADAKKPREHTEIQWHLLKLGADMGFDLWGCSQRPNQNVGRKKVRRLSTTQGGTSITI